MRKIVSLINRAIARLMEAAIVSAIFTALLCCFYTGFGNFTKELPSLGLLLLCWAGVALIMAGFFLSYEFNWAKRKVPQKLQQFASENGYPNVIAISGHSWFKWCCGKPMIKLVCEEYGAEFEIRVCPSCGHIQTRVYEIAYCDGIREDWRYRWQTVQG